MTDSSRTCIGPIPDFRAQVPFEVRSANTLIRIESRLPGLLGSLGSLGMQVDYRRCEVVTTSSRGMPASIRKKLSDAPTPPEAQRLYPDALELYVDTPFAWATPQTGATIESHTFEWAVRAQFILSTQSQTLYFPAPAVKDPIRFGPEYAQADFTTTHRPFWADEYTHKAQ
ncbi:hypothetical protein ACCD10_29205 [Pseudomonas sp. Pseusp122]|uniref:hypothetical protein n=1 Tax=Pseudomonas sp. Pseusp122 TaxID=3243009 RepID=UPI0039AFCF81